MAKKRLTSKDVLQLLREQRVRDARHYRQGGTIPGVRKPGFSGPTMKRGDVVQLQRLPTARIIAPGSKPVIPVALPVAKPLVTAKRILPAVPVVRGRVTPALKKAIGLDVTDEPVYVLARKQINEVEKALTPEAYRAKYGYARDITQPTISARGQTIAAPIPTGRSGLKGGQLEVMQGPAALNHSGRLRKNGKPSKHWAAFAYLLRTGDNEFLGVEFFSGFRCYYPSTTAADYYAILTAGSGSYFVHDFLIGKTYVSF